METSKTNVVLKIVVVENKVMANLTFINNTKSIVYIDKMLGGYQSNIDSDVFNVTRNKETVDYEGIIVKRGPLTAKDFFILEAGKDLKTTVDITKNYDFKKGNHYVAHYDAIHQSPNLKDGIITKFISNEVGFTF